MEWSRELVTRRLYLLRHCHRFLQLVFLRLLLIYHDLDKDKLKNAILSVKIRQHVTKYRKTIFNGKSPFFPPLVFNMALTSFSRHVPSNAIQSFDRAFPAHLPLTSAALINKFVFKPLQPLRFIFASTPIT